jgi:hypothetical protein
MFLLLSLAALLEEDREFLATKKKHQAANQLQRQRDLRESFFPPLVSIFLSFNVWLIKKHFITLFSNHCKTVNRRETLAQWIKRHLKTRQTLIELYAMFQVEAFEEN